MQGSGPEAATRGGTLNSSTRHLEKKKINKDKTVGAY